MEAPRSSAAPRCKSSSSARAPPCFLLSLTVFGLRSSRRLLNSPSWRLRSSQRLLRGLWLSCRHGMLGGCVVGASMVLQVCTQGGCGGTCTLANVVGAMPTGCLPHAAHEETCKGGAADGGCRHGSYVLICVSVLGLTPVGLGKAGATLWADLTSLHTGGLVSACSGHGRIRGKLPSQTRARDKQVPWSKVLIISGDRR